jgi:predicted DNA-binding protein
VYYAISMPISVRLPPRLERQLAKYCARTKLTRSGAVKRALERMFEQEALPAAANPAAKRYVGSDPQEGDVARRSKQLLRERFRRYHTVTVTKRRSSTSNP